MDKRLKVGFDLDRVFIGYPPLIPQDLIDWLYKHSLQEVLSFKIHSEQKTFYRFPNSPAEQLLRQLSHFFLLRPKLKTNIDYVNKLKERSNIEIYLISSRYKFLEKITFKILKRYNLSTTFKKIYLNLKNEQPHEFKERIICETKLDVFIDDDIRLLKYLKDRCPKTKLIWYNPMNHKTEHDGITMIREFSELSNFIK